MLWPSVCLRFFTKAWLPGSQKRGSSSFPKSPKPSGSEAVPNTELSERLRALGYTTKGAPESP